MHALPHLSPQSSWDGPVAGEMQMNFGSLEVLKFPASPALSMGAKGERRFNFVLLGTHSSPANKEAGAICWAVRRGRE